MWHKPLSGIYPFFLHFLCVTLQYRAVLPNCCLHLNQEWQFLSTTEFCAKEFIDSLEKEPSAALGLKSKIIWQFRQIHQTQASLVSPLLPLKTSDHLQTKQIFLFVCLNLLQFFTAKFLFHLWNFHFGQSCLILLCITLTSAKK